MGVRKKQGNRRNPQPVSWREHGARAWAFLRRALPALCLLAGAGVALQQLDRAMAIRAWQVRCDDATLQQAISQRLRHMAPLGFLSGQPALLARRLRALEPDIASIEVERYLPGRLKIHAVIRRPEALWTAGDGRIVLVDRTGVPYRQLRHGEALDLPLLRGADRAALPALVRLLHHLRARDAHRFSEVSEMVVRDRLLRINLSRGMQWRLHLDDGALQQVDRIITLLNEPRWRHGYWRVDARQRDRWFVRAGSGDREVI